MLLDQVLDRVKRKWLKLVKVEKKSLFTLEQKDMDIIIQELQGKAFEQDTNVQQPTQNSQQDIGHVKNYGQAKVVVPSHHRKIDKENISIFVISNNH